MIKIASPIGTRSPAWDGWASGKVLLAWLPEDEVAAMLPPAEEWPLASGPNVPAGPKEFLDQLAAVRENGYAVGDEETDRDAWAAGAPIRDYTGAVVGAITVPVLKARVRNLGHDLRLIEATTDAASVISRSLGYCGA